MYIKFNMMNLCYKIDININFLQSKYNSNLLPYLLLNFEYFSWSLMILCKPLMI